MKTLMANIILSVFCLFPTQKGAAYPFSAHELMPTNVLEELSPIHYEQIKLFPHQLAVCDFICTGTVTATNDGFSAMLAVNEIIWGNSVLTNITVRCVDPAMPTKFSAHGNYLILAYTNNWWTGEESIEHNSFFNLFDYTASTNIPQNHAVFEDYRILDPLGGAISFDDIIVGGTNYWEGTRTFVTNFIDVAKIPHNETNAYRKIYWTLRRENEARVLPHHLKIQLALYEWLRYLSEHLPPPEP